MANISKRKSEQDVEKMKKLIDDATGLKKGTFADPGWDRDSLKRSLDIVAEMEKYKMADPYKFEAPMTSLATGGIKPRTGYFPAIGTTVVTPTIRPMEPIVTPKKNRDFKVGAKGFLTDYDRFGDYRDHNGQMFTIINVSNISKGHIDIQWADGRTSSVYESYDWSGAYLVEDTKREIQVGDTVRCIQGHHKNHGSGGSGWVLDREFEVLRIDKLAPGDNVYFPVGGGDGVFSGWLELVVPDETKKTKPKDVFSWKWKKEKA